MAIPESLRGQLRLPVIGSPLFIVSNPRLVIEQCKAGVIGSFPALNARPAPVLEQWLVQITEELAAFKRQHPERKVAPFAVNQIVHASNDRLASDVALCEKYRVPIQITSLRAPDEVVQSAHSYGGLVYHDVTNVKHAKRALQAGVDGLILVCSGAGGHAGSLSPFALLAEVREFYDGTITATRNFYGVLRVWQTGSDDNVRRSLIHCTIMNGNQYRDATLRKEPTTCYTATSGDCRAIESMHPRIEPLKVGIIGLGTGTIAAWGAKGDIYRFYDINPSVVDIARRDFTYLEDSEATIQTPLGDARLVLEREPSQGFDILAIDAFSSDAIPVHLITSEALAIYRRHMKPSGIIAFHVTNRFLNLVPVVEALAHAHELAVAWVSDDGDGVASRSDWVLLSPDAEALKKPLIAEATTPIEPRRDWRLWTDDFNNLVQVLK